MSAMTVGVSAPKRSVMTRCNSSVARPFAPLKRSTRCAAKLYQDASSAIPPTPSKGMRARNKLVVDEAKEISRTYRRSVYDFDYWANHRSTSRFYFHIVSLPNSRIIRSLAIPLAWVCGTAFVVCLDHDLVRSGVIPAALEFPVVNMIPVNLTSFALSLLLVFRTNSSYGRFDEARKMWGLALNRSRDLVRQAVSFFPEGGEHIERTATFARWVSCFMVVLKCHLRPREDMRGEAAKLLSPEELELLMASDHKVLLCLQAMSHIIDESGVSDFQALQMQQNLTTYEDILGGCERLLRTPIPVAYTRHTSRFLLIWLTILPFAFSEQLKYGSIPACGFIALLLLGIEEIGVEIEDPFGILPLEVIANKAKADVIELVNRQESCKAVTVLNDQSGQEAVNNEIFNLAPPASSDNLQWPRGRT